MSKIKELWWMAKQLFTKIDKDRVEYKQKILTNIKSKIERKHTKSTVITGLWTISNHCDNGYNSI